MKIASSPAANTPISTEYRQSVRTLRQFRRAKPVSTGMATTKESSSTLTVQTRGAGANCFGSSNIGRGHLDKTSRPTHASVYTPTINSHGIAQSAENHHSIRALPVMFAKTVSLEV